MPPLPPTHPETTETEAKDESLLDKLACPEVSILSMEGDAVCQSLQNQTIITHVRIQRCMHGSNFLSLGNLTLSLADSELVLIDRAIHKLAQRHPMLQQSLYKGLCANNVGHDDEENGL